MMNGFRNVTMWAVALATSATIGIAAQQPAAPVQPAQPAAPTTTPTQQPTTPAQPTAPPAPETPLGPTQAAPLDQYVVGSAKAPDTGKPVVNMSLDQAMQTALDKNLGLKAARFNPGAVDYQLLAARAVFSPTFTGTYSYRSSDALNNNNLEESGIITTGTQQFNGGASMPLPWYGSNVSASFTNNRVFSSSSQTILNPSFASGLSLTFTQPLLQGFRIDQNREAIDALVIQRQITDTQLVATIENTKYSVLTAYWNLKQTIEQIEIERRALDLANQLLANDKVQVEIGTLAPLSLAQDNVGVANAKEGLLNAQIQWQTAEIALDQLLATGPDDDIFKATINPTETPALASMNVDIPGAVKTALNQRTDLVEARKNIDMSNVSLALSKDLLRPQLNLTAAYSASGQGGTIVSKGNALGAGGGYSQALSQLFQFQVPTWQAAFNVTYPLFEAANKANFARSAILVEQSQAQLKASELSVASSVTTAGLAVQNAALQYQAAQEASDAQNQTTSAELTKYSIGTSTNYLVVQQEDNLTSARLTELQRLITYIEAVAQFQLVQRVGAQ